MDLLWPSIALIVSLHFLPLAWLYRVKPYYWVGLIGGGNALLALSSIEGGRSLAVLGAGQAIVFWIGGVYLLVRADRLADTAAGQVHPLARDT
jgi:hypothetical protein